LRDHTRNFASLYQKRNYRSRFRLTEKSKWPLEDGDALEILNDCN
jgi:hypothetical protein